MTEKKKKDPVKFLIHAAVWALLIMALLHAFKPVLAPDPREPEIQLAQQQLITVFPEALPVRLTTSSKPTLLVIYASWCGFCQQVLPQLLNKLADGHGDRVQPFFLSVDREKHDLARYLVYTGYGSRYTPYIVAEWQSGAPLTAALAQIGADYTGAIPYIALFDKKKIKMEISGVPSQKELQNLLQAVPASANP